MPNEIECLTESQLAEAVAFINMYPCGEEAMDIRFELLRMELADWMNNLIYAVYKSAGMKLSKPKRQKFDAFKMFKRGIAGKTKIDFRDMDQAEVAARMDAFAHRMVIND